MKLITTDWVRKHLPPRNEDAHKGTFGRVLVVAGSHRMCGAGYLCALSALRAGAGLVAWALPDRLQPSFAAALPEVITVPLPCTKEGVISAQAQTKLKHFCTQFTPSVIAVGPGMGKSPLLRFILEKVPVPLVVDADALNFIAAHRTVRLPDNRPCIFTPHPGEMARLLGSAVAQTDSLRQSQAEEWACKTGNVVVLKGNGSLVAGKGKLIKNTTGGPALAKGGNGDVLTGIIAGLWGQLGTASHFDFDTSWQAAVCGVYIHGLAGDLMTRDKTSYGVLASEVANRVPIAIKQILETRR